MVNQLETGALENLLGWDGDFAKETATLELERPGFTFKVVCRAVTSEEQRSIEDSCMEWTKSGGRMVREVNEFDYLLKLMFACIQEPDLKDERLQQKFNAGKAAYRIVQALFKPGEQIQLAKVINRLSGFTDSDQMDADIENLLKKSKTE